MNGKSKKLTFYSGLATLLLFTYGILLPFIGLGSFAYPILKLISILIIFISILHVFITLNFWRNDKHARQITITFLVIILTISFLPMLWFSIFLLIPFLIELILLIKILKNTHIEEEEGVSQYKYRSNIFRIILILVFVLVIFLFLKTLKLF